MTPRLAYRRVHSGQIVAAQVAAVLVVATSGHPGGIAAAAVLITVGFGRLRGRWLYRWGVVVAGLATRRRRAPSGADAATLLALTHPGVRVAGAPVDGRPAAVLSGRYGRTAVLRVDEPAGGLAGPVHLPVVDDLPATVRILVAVRSPPRDDPPTRSYRALAGGGAAASRTVLLAVGVPPGGDLDPVVREIARRAAPASVCPLSDAGLRAALTDLSVTPPVREGFSAVRAGGLAHASYHLPTATENEVPRLLSLPAAATVVAVQGGQVMVRVATGSGEQVRAVERALCGSPGSAYRLDGEHLPGLAATLPLATPVATARVPAAGAGLRLDPAGVMLGRDQRGAPVLASMFGPAPVRVVLVADLWAALLLAWRAAGAGARVHVQTSRTKAWRALAAAAGGAPLRLDDARAEPCPGQPALHLVDTPSGEPSAPAAWCAQVVVRTRLTAADAGLLARAGLVLARALNERESTLVNAALGLGRAGTGLEQPAPWALTAISRGTVSEIAVSMSATERDLLHLDQPPHRPALSPSI